MISWRARPRWRACKRPVSPLPTRGSRSESERRRFPDGSLGPDPRFFDPDYRTGHTGTRQALWLSSRERARERALLPPAEPVIRERLCRICKRSVAWGVKRWYCECCRATLNNGFNQRLVRQRRALRLCVRCAVATVKGQARCARCMVLERRRYNPKVAAAHHKRLLASRRARAVCSLCEEQVATGRARCAACLSDARARHKRERAGWRASGRCGGCGRTPRRGRLCEVCRARGKQVRANNVAQGFCHCGRLLAPGRKNCTDCLAKALEYQRRRAATPKQQPPTDLLLHVGGGQ